MEINSWEEFGEVNWSDWSVMEEWVESQEESDEEEEEV